MTGYGRRVLALCLLVMVCAVGSAVALSAATSDPVALRARLAAWIGPDRPLPTDPLTTGSLSIASVVLDPCTGLQKR
jgi:hypothetical protein